MKLSKVKELYLKYQLPFTLAVSTIILIISTFWNPAIYIAAGFIVISYIFFSIEDICAGTFYYMWYSGFTAFFVTVAVGTFLIIFIKYVVDLYKKEVKFYKYPLIFTTIICIIFSLIHYKVNEYGVFVGLLIIGVLYFIYVIFCYHKNLSIRRMFLSLFAGLIASTVISISLSFIPSAKIFMFYDWEFVYRPIRDKMFLVYKTTYRVELFTYHPNHLACYCLFLMSYGIYSIINYKNTKKDLVINILMIIIPITLGLLTLSKAFFILFIAEVVYFIVYLAIEYKKNSIKFIVPIIFIFGVICFIFNSQILQIYGRLLPNESSNNINDITTGRVDIWKMYLSDMIDSPLKMLFGEGIFTNDIVEIGPHNFYVYLFFRFGIVGLLMLACLTLIYVLEYDEKILLSWRRVLPLLLYFAYSLQEANNDERILLFVMAIILMFQRNKDDKKYGKDNADKEKIDLSENVVVKE